MSVRNIIIFHSGVEPVTGSGTYGLLLIVTITWILTLAESYVFFGVVRPLAPNIHESAASALLKIAATIVLVLVWAGAMVYMRSVFMRRARPLPKS
ncbi:MAG: hypothetical protein OK455_04035 [Thaumarchaeota archaeon]|nr:hypothetical protein [Nitrososphaerota archaeon]